MIKQRRKDFTFEILLGDQPKRERVHLAGVAADDELNLAVGAGFKRVCIPGATQAQQDPAISS